MPIDREPQVSIIIPSHNRRARLVATLDAIAGQRFALDVIEVVIVADGCHDDTVAAVAAYAAPFTLRLVETPGLGPAPARNRGAELARAPLLLFLDDDVEPLEGWIAAHVEAHQAHPGSAVIGSYPPSPVNDGAFRQKIRLWWMAHFDEVERPGHRFSMSDLLTGNLSLSRELWDALGGLDPDFAFAREDGEFGVRLVQRGVRIVHAPGAFCWHREDLDLSAALRRKREEGRADVRLGTKHPHIKDRLEIVQFWHLRDLRGRAARLLFVSRRFTRLARTLTEGLAARMTRGRPGRLFSAAYDAAQLVAYVSGATEQLRSLQALRRFVDDRPDVRRRATMIDLQEGIDHAERKLDRERPDHVRLTYGVLDIGWLPDAPGSEKWAGRHLRPFLSHSLAGKMLRALQESDALLPEGLSGRPQVEAWDYVGRSGYAASAGEAYRQWARSGL